MIHLNPQWIDMAQAILREHIPDRHVKIFGSRSSGVRLKKHSDIDLCIMGEAPIAAGILFRLREAFSESDLPMKVDVVQWHETSPVFRANIEKDLQDFYKP